MNAKIARDLILKAHPDGLSSENLCELFFENIIQIESNWTYEIIRRNSGQMVVNSYPREELIDIHKRKDYSSESFLRFRAAVAQSFFDPLKRNGCKVKILRSVHLGDPYCRFSIDLPRQ